VRRPYNICFKDVEYKLFATGYDPRAGSCGFGNESSIPVKMGSLLTGKFSALTKGCGPWDTKDFKPVHLTCEAREM
jgi:hypothetical protein